MRAALIGAAAVVLGISAPAGADVQIFSQGFLQHQQNGGSNPITAVTYTAPANLSSIRVDFTVSTSISFPTDGPGAYVGDPFGGQGPRAVLGFSFAPSPVGFSTTDGVCSQYSCSYTGSLTFSDPESLAYFEVGDFHVASPFSHFTNLASDYGRSRMQQISTDVGGTVTFFASGVPEPASWAMMLVGFGAIGRPMRRRQAVLAASSAL